ncbi:MAG: tRNA (adenosine(37)-N6)-threonylcarbamoyltransferase complex dimerization subunit type 1 TsaB [Flavobacteriaceae bacterium]|nr:tRNA (adenosine(37)-N6)-threonylcarbamoyltransferase complex dimerization subunit type 1 TsaB [Flavobacteriaceae bacterium]
MHLDLETLTTYILNIETATKNCSVSIAKNGELLAFKDINTGNYSHAESLHPLIEALLKEAHINFKDLDAVAVGKGPGSFTGLRIGVSAAKGLCFALQIPLIAIDSLTILAHALKIEEGFIIPLLDARRMEVYTTVCDNAQNQLSAIEAKILDEHSFIDFLDKAPVCFLGDGVEKFKPICKHKNAIFKEGYFPSAKEMVHLSFIKYKKNDTEDVAYFEPFYLKNFLVTKSKKPIF